MIELKNVSKTYCHNGRKIPALDDINLKINAGEIFGIIGHSGAGKSTLIRCINLLEPIDNGEVIVDQQSLTQLSSAKLRQARRQMGMIFQHFNLISNYTVYKNVALPLILKGTKKSIIKETVLPLLKLVGLENKHNRYPAQLSGGQKQRVAIARALVTQPKVLLCDEATSALDPETTASILDLLKEINQQYHISIVIITHEMQVIKQIADRVAVISEGRIIEENNVIDLFMRPKTEISKNFVSTILGHQPTELLTNHLTQTPENSKAIMARLLFHQDSTEAPVITDLIKNFDVTVSILKGTVEIIHNQTIGILFVEILGDPSKFEHIDNYLQQENVDFEVLGYVA
ncbi:MAG: ATP-binding cassette domain-containing protein [Pseudomonadota bacterium]